MVNLAKLPRSAMQSALHWAEMALFPPTCVLCADPGQAPRLDLCAGCAGDLPHNRCACRRCGEPITASDAVCGECLRRPPRFDRAYCAHRYQFPVDHLVRGLKYHGRMAYARVLGHLLAEHLQAMRDLRPDYRWPDCVVPVPLADARFRERGFNQAIEIGRELRKRLDIELRCDVVTRIRDTREQAGLDRKARHKNVRNAFRVDRTFSARRVAILDDVITTGSTANELARILRKAGVEEIEVWAVARAGK